MNLTLDQAEYLLSEAEPELLEDSRAEVAFIGRSNVGKSSLLNALCRKRGLAKVSKTPGRTQTVNIFAVGHLRWLVDLPGYGYAAAPVYARERWSSMIETYFTSRSALRGVFLLIDAKVGPTVLDHQMLQWIKDHGIPFYLVGNKIDQVKPSQQHAQKKRIAEELEIAASDIQWVSAAKETGMSALRQSVVKLLERNAESEPA
jgi:GTP-binding protein